MKYSNRYVTTEAAVPKKILYRLPVDILAVEPKPSYTYFNTPNCNVIAGKRAKNTIRDMDIYTHA